MMNLTIILKRLWKILDYDYAAWLVELVWSDLSKRKSYNLLNFTDCAVNRTMGVGAVCVLKSSI